MVVGMKGCLIILLLGSYKFEYEQTKYKQLPAAIGAIGS